MGELSNWYHVRFDETSVYRDVQPEGKEPWEDQFEWKDVIRVCYQLGDLYVPDELYIFTNKRSESYLIPIEADGGLELWNEIIHRKLFPAALAIKVATTLDGLYCWPEDDE